MLTTETELSTGSSLTSLQFLLYLYIFSELTLNTIETSMREIKSLRLNGSSVVHDNDTFDLQREKNNCIVMCISMNTFRKIGYGDGLKLKRKNRKCVNKIGSFVAKKILQNERLPIILIGKRTFAC